MNQAPLLLSAILIEARQRRLPLSLIFSLSLHTFLLFGIGVAVPDPGRVAESLKPLEVVLVNSRSINKPSQATAFAQHNLDGGGNTPEDRHAQTPLPTLSDSERFVTEQSLQRMQQLEQEARRLMTQLHGQYQVPAETAQPQPAAEANDSQDMVQQALEIARLEAQISRNMQIYEKMPKRKFIGARTQEYRYAQYVEDWRSKVERIGNLNYPQQAREQKIYGKLTLTVAIRSDGTVESVEINRSSGKPLLDAAAQRIVKLAAPYAPFPPDIRKEVDILSITRTWTFTTADQLESE